MALRRGLTRFEQTPRGGADLWDKDPAGRIFRLELFGAPAPIVVNGLAITVTEGSPTVIQPSGAQTIAPNGLTITVTEGSPTVRAVARIVVNGLTITVTEGSPTVRAVARIVANGVTITVTEGLPAVLPGPRTIAALGAVVTVTEGSPAVRAVVRIDPIGVPILVSFGAPSVQSAGAGVQLIQILDGKGIFVVFGAPSVFDVASLGKPIALAPDPALRGFPTGRPINRPPYWRSFRKG